MYINVPANLNPNETSLFYIDSGNNNATNELGGFTDYIAKTSTICNCITVSMRQIPNQPIEFFVIKTSNCLC